MSVLGCMSGQLLSQKPLKWKSSSFQFSPVSASFSYHDKQGHWEWAGLNTGTEQQHSSGSPTLFPSCTQERCGSYTELLLNLGSDFAERVLLITSSLAFTSSALRTFPLQHQTCAYTLITLQQWCESKYGKKGAKEDLDRKSWGWRITRELADCLLQDR